jgi:hypothetical protein
MSCDLFVTKINDVFKLIETNLQTANELKKSLTQDDISNLKINDTITRYESMQSSWNKIKPIICKPPCEMKEIVSDESEPRCKCSENIKTLFLETYNIFNLAKINKDIYTYIKENIYELSYSILTIVKVIDAKFNNMPQELKNQLEIITGPSLESNEEVISTDVSEIIIKKTNNITNNMISPLEEPSKISYPSTSSTSSKSSTNNSNINTESEKYKFIISNLKDISMFPYSKFDVLKKLNDIISLNVFYYLNEHNYKFIMKYLNKLSIINDEIDKIKNDNSIESSIKGMIIGKLEFFKSVNMFIINLVELVRFYTKYTHNDENLISNGCFSVKCPDKACKIETGFGYKPLPITTEQITKYITIIDEYSKLINVEISKISNIKTCEFKKCSDEQVINPDNCNCTLLKDLF